MMLTKVNIFLLTILPPSIRLIPSGPGSGIGPKYLGNQKFPSGCRYSHVILTYWSTTFLWRFLAISRSQLPKFPEIGNYGKKSCTFSLKVVTKQRERKSIQTMFILVCHSFLFQSSQGSSNLSVSFL